MNEIILPDLASGFTISVKPLPPYYMDWIDDVYPVPEYPKRQIKLMTGDTDYWPYKPPDIQPSEDNREEYELYQRWLVADAARGDIENKRNRARRDFMLSNCVTVVAGPYTMDDPEWLENVEAPFVASKRVPMHKGYRKLLFIKTQVIVTLDDWVRVSQTATYEEVAMSGVVAAMRGYEIKWLDDDLFIAIERLEKGNLSHNMRLWEAQTAAIHGIPFDSTWYRIPVVARERMVAAHISNMFSAVLQSNDAARKMR